MTKSPRNLSDLQIRNLKRPERRIELPFGEGLYLVHAPTGSKSWAFRYRAFDRPKKLTLGRYVSPTDMLPEVRAAHPRLGGSLSIAGARLLAQQSKLILQQGGNPQQVLSGAGPKPKPKEISAVFDEFVKDHVDVHNKASTAAETKRLFERKIKPVWSGRSIDGIRRSDVVELLQGIRDAGAPVSANRTLALVRKFFNWCLEQELIETSPCARVRSPAPEVSRDRVLSDNEVGLVWRASARLRNPYRQFVRLLLLTGQRRGEIAKLRWSQVDFDESRLTFSRGETKNKKPHLAHLSRAARDEILLVKPISGSPDYVFASGRRNGGGALTPFSGFSKLKVMLDELIKQVAAEEEAGHGDAANTPATISQWRWHDLRRTVATGMQKLGVEQRVVEKALNHISGSTGGLVSVYQVHDFLEERRQAFDRWSDRVEALGER